MSSRVFQARTAHTSSNPQICGLTGNHISKNDWIMFLVCRGADAVPEYQIKCTAEREVEKEYYSRRKRRKVKTTTTQRDYGTDDGKQFRSVYDGKRRNSEGKMEKVFLWQQQDGLDADGLPRWITVKCWSNVVHASAAEDLGFDVRADANGEWVTTIAFEGDRTRGNEHTVETEPENAMTVIARAVLSDEEAGLVAPGTVDVAAENEAETERMSAEIASDVDAEERRDAEALGMTLEQYRKVNA